MVRTIKLLDIVAKCKDEDDGKVVFDTIKTILDTGGEVKVSFNGVYSIPTSFINTAFIELLHYYPIEQIKARLSFADSTKHINESLKRRFSFEATRVGNKNGFCCVN